MTDTFRKEYQPLSERQKMVMSQIKIKADELLSAFSLAEESEHDRRCMALAKTNLEQAIMWVVKAIT